jgi:hypothetical protein
MGKNKGKQAEAAVAEAESKTAPKSKRLSEIELSGRYPHIVLGTLRMETDGKHKGKQTVDAQLECGHLARVATSDLFQVKRCAECRKPAKKTVPPPALEPVMNTSDAAEGTSL